MRGFGVSFSLGHVGQQRARHWYVREDGVRRWADNDQPCEPQGSSKPMCAVDGVLRDGQALCGKASVGNTPKCCNSSESCQHQQEGK